MLQLLQLHHSLLQMKPREDTTKCYVALLIANGAVNQPLSFSRQVLHTALLVNQLNLKVMLTTFL
uniref:Uncharacterized protein n=1 Tax=Arundo donax TaxID=35708 RepID=A0A0A9E8W9_ARUDO